jgi:DNA-binding MarR family transcriptional regulator
VEPEWLDAREDRAWRGFVFAHQQLVAYLNRRLQESGLSGPDYEILSALTATDGDCLPARELCAVLHWEKSRLSHQLRRMENDGLVGREPNPNDARSTLVRLTPAGRAAIERAAPDHVAEVRRHFVDQFTAAELDTIATLHERLLDHVATLGDSPAGEAP